MSHQALITELIRLYDEIALPAHQNTMLRGAETKEDGTVVTKVDREASERLTEVLKRETPSYGIISEEEEQPYQPEADWQWVIDPLDGTASFSRGYPVWGLGIGLLHRGNPVEGTLRFPVLGETYRHDGKVFSFNDRPVPPLSHEALPDTINYLVDSSLHKRYDSFSPLRPYKIRIFGSTLYHMVAVAMGRAEAMMCGRVKLWDLAAALPMTRAQGLVERHMDGSPLNLSELTLDNGFQAREPMVIGPPGEVERLLEALGKLS